jgi:hypothetical protein
MSVGTAPTSIRKRKSKVAPAAESEAVLLPDPQPAPPPPVEPKAPSGPKVKPETVEPSTESGTAPVATEAIQADEVEPETVEAVVDAIVEMARNATLIPAVKPEAVEPEPQASIVALADDLASAREAVERAALAFGAGVKAGSSLAMDRALEAVAKNADIRRKTIYVNELEGTWQDAKIEAADAKKAWESAAKALHSFIIQGEETLPLFDSANDDETETVQAVQAPTPAPSVAPAPKAVEVVETLPDGAIDTKPGESWRRVEIDALDLSDIIVEKLRGYISKITPKGINTVGDMTDFQTASGLWNDIPGIGAVAANKIDDAHAAFWKGWKQRNNTPSQENATAINTYELSCTSTDGVKRVLTTFNGSLAEAEAKADDMESAQGIVVNILMDCPDCEGSGDVQGVECASCDGVGRIDPFDQSPTVAD